jgi:hypothetical protein
MSEFDAVQDSEAGSSSRRPYEKPALVIYGNVEEMTRGTSGSKKEPGPFAKPKS